MQIKNTEELVRRAKVSRRQDRIIQRTYANTKGITVRGCAINCLANTPANANILKFWSKAATSDHHQRKRLGEEFGMVPRLCYLAEGFFEVQKSTRSAREFVVHFAEALPEGADITNDDIWRFCQEELRGLQCNDWAGVSQRVQTLGVTKTTERFLQWLEARTPALGTAEVQA